MRACAVVMSTDSWWLTRVAAALALIALACATAETRAPVDTRAAVVDMKRAMMECREGRAAREELMKDFRASQATLDKQQEDLVRRMQAFKQYRDRGLQPPDDEATLKRDLAALQHLYRQLQKRLTDEEARRAAPIRARLEETLTQLKAQRHIEKVSIVSPAPADDARTIDLTADLIRAADAQAPLP